MDLVEEVASVSTSGSSVASTPATAGRGRRCGPASSASCTIRANTHDQSPPPRRTSRRRRPVPHGCGIHDFDIIRFVTGLEVATVFATGANKGEDFFAEGGDVDTAAAC